MTRASQWQLHLVEPVRVEGPDLSPAEEKLAELVPELIDAEETLSATRALVDMWRHRLAKERGVSFIREEHVRREFGR